jgi:signal-transduction protein with cAMP-binding, CBS, and nucleotidyltransferase domain
VTADTLRKSPIEEYEATTVGEVATTDLPRLDSETSAFDALIELTGNRAGAAIIERDGAPVAALSRSDITAVLDLRRDTTAF